tara:strand:+ start:355 stop:573 length:219 start_codon:yes stop_codon:yes gene_type:complete
MCRGCELGNVEEYLIYHQAYKDAIQAMKEAEQKLHRMKQTCKPEHRKAVDTHHKRLVRLRKEYGRIDQEFKL